MIDDPSVTKSINRSILEHMAQVFGPNSTAAVVLAEAVELEREGHEVEFYRRGRELWVDPKTNH
ncbi:hypothetical protein [Pseudomonas fluorescens]|uniref:hypothetical protein n=1 Tax=Pseudomonas fluorescens TaxID=294 RepID=UPI0010E5EFB3|nr:hypothetical protein [Pseudomonas fluorescens]TCV62753.1 hypothetical protein EDB98_11261 [Pseudomonas fluorescens]